MRVGGDRRGIDVDYVVVLETIWFAMDEHA
jgi:hypothetical protein